MNPFYPDLELDVITYLAPIILVLGFVTLVNEEYEAHNRESIALKQRGSDSYITAFLSLVTSGVALSYAVYAGYALACCVFHWIGLVFVATVVVLPVIVGLRCFISGLRVMNPFIQLTPLPQH